MHISARADASCEDKALVSSVRESLCDRERSCVECVSGNCRRHEHSSPKRRCECLRRSLTSAARARKKEEICDGRVHREAHVPRGLFRARDVYDEQAISPYSRFASVGCARSTHVSCAQGTSQASCTLFAAPFLCLRSVVGSVRVRERGRSIPFASRTPMIELVRGGARFRGQSIKGTCVCIVCES